MKKVLFTTLSIIAVAAMMFVSCKKDEPKPDDNKGKTDPVEEYAGPVVGTENWAIIGTILSTNWDTDYKAAAVEENIFVVKNVKLEAANEFKWRDTSSGNGGWDVNRGGDFVALGEAFDVEANGHNIKPELDGIYDIYLNLAVDQAAVVEKDGAQPTWKEPAVAVVAANWAEVEAADGVKFFQYWTTGDWGNPTVPATDAVSFDNVTVANGVYTVDYTAGAPELWMAQLFIRPNPEKATLPLAADKKYHVAITIKSSAAMTPWVKFTKYVAEPNNDPNSEAYKKHEGDCIWECGTVALAADTPHTFEFVASGVECDNVNWTMGLGGHNGATITISDIKVEELTYTDLSTINALEANADFNLTAVVAASFKISNSNSAAIVTDGTNCFYLFFNPATNNTLEVGDLVIAKGKISIYNKLIESVKNPEVTVLAKGVAVPELTPVEITSFDDFLSKNEPTGLYTAAGKYVVDGNYTNLVMEGSTKVKGSLSGELDANLNGKDVTVTGWFTGGNSSATFAYLRVTSIVKNPVKITIDGDMSEWAEVDALNTAATSRIRGWKVASDAENLYFYFALRKDRADNGRKLVIGFNTDKDATTGKLTDNNNMKGCEAIVKDIIPCTNASGAANTFLTGTGSGTAISTAGAETANAAICWGVDTGDADNVFVELSVPKAALALPAGEIQVGASYEYYFTEYSALTF